MARGTLGRCGKYRRFTLHSPGREYLYDNDRNSGLNIALVRGGDTLMESSKRHAIQNNGSGLRGECGAIFKYARNSSKSST